jgi:hypothetical protein
MGMNSEGRMRGLSPIGRCGRTGKRSGRDTSGKVANMTNIAGLFTDLPDIHDVELTKWLI